ncbi:MAG: hypothetical protein PHS93_10105 [Candidatus Omnitrophica bacterium]|nr:hypothetical protein [Candidatus Omnitrophota bacterium]
MLWTAIKNSKNIIVGIIITCLLVSTIYFWWRTTDLKADYAKEKIKMYESMVVEQKAHNARLQKISNETGEISKRIKNLNIKDKTQDEVYYSTANDIVNRFNGVR